MILPKHCQLFFNMFSLQWVIIDDILLIKVVRLSMSINARFKEIRLINELSQDEYGKRLQITRSHVSSLENGARPITERTIKDICREFEVNEQWLRTGEGEMYIIEEDFIALIASNLGNLDDDEVKLISNFIRLDKKTRKAFIKFIQSLSEK